MPVARQPSTLARMLPWESITPFGRPAVPEVKQMVASASSAAGTTENSPSAGGRNDSTVRTLPPFSARAQRIALAGTPAPASAAAIRSVSTTTSRAPAAVAQYAWLSGRSSA